LLVYDYPQTVGFGKGKLWNGNIIFLNLLVRGLRTGLLESQFLVQKICQNCKANENTQNENFTTHVCSISTFSI